MLKRRGSDLISRFLRPLGCPSGGHFFKGRNGGNADVLVGDQLSLLPERRSRRRPIGARPVRLTSIDHHCNAHTARDLNGWSSATLGRADSIVIGNPVVAPQALTVRIDRLNLYIQNPGPARLALLRYRSASLA